MIIVPDTNVIISAQIEKRGYSSQILDLWGQGKIEFAVSPPLLAEYRQALSYDRVQKRLNWSKQDIAGTVSDLEQGSQVVPGTIPIDVSPDPDDNALFSCAIEAQANYIVSGDTKHVLIIPEFRGIRTINPRDFVEKVLPKAV